jgi:hypothetical protein
MSITSVDVSLFDSSGYVSIAWNDTGKSGGFEAWRVYRRDLDAAGAWVLVAQTTGNAATDYLAPANRSVEVSVVQVTTGNVEGAYTDSITVTPVATNYWLIHEADSALNFRLEHVTSDSFVDEYEEETIKLIGRGRKKELGTRWGYAGELTATIRPKNGKTSLAQKIEIEQLKLRQGEGSIYVRTPFGDVVKSSLGAISWGRLEGSGTDAWYDVTISYEEVH